MLTQLAITHLIRQFHFHLDCHIQWLLGFVQYYLLPVVHFCSHLQFLLLNIYKVVLIESNQLLLSLHGEGAKLFSSSKSASLPNVMIKVIMNRNVMTEKAIAHAMQEYTRVQRNFITTLPLFKFSQFLSLSKFSYFFSLKNSYR